MSEKLNILMHSTRSTTDMEGLVVLLRWENQSSSVEIVKHMHALGNNQPQLYSCTCRFQQNKLVSQFRINTQARTLSITDLEVSGIIVRNTFRRFLFLIFIFCL
jgi:hypothetical protein